MKLSNAPARKLARQIAAKEGGSCRHVSLNRVEMIAARERRHKKWRGKRRQGGIA